MVQKKLFKVKVIPSSSKQLVTQKEDNSFLIEVKSPPSGGKANKECLEALSLFLGLKEGALRILRGGHSRNKIIEWTVEK